MEDMLSKAKHFLEIDPKFAGIEVRADQGELHLFYGDDRFARLIPTEKEGIWRMEYFQNRERWECLDFQGTLKECLDFLADNTHFIFWEG